MPSLESVGHAAALWAGLHLFLLLVLSVLVVRLRQKHKVALGGEGIPELRAPSAKANWSLWAKTAASSTKSILTAITQRTMQQLPPTRTNRQRPLASDAVTSYRQGRRSSKPWRNFK